MSTAIAKTKPSVPAKPPDLLRRLYKVILSYSTKDLPLVHECHDILKLANVEVFFAHASVKPGEKLTPSINNAISGCDVFVLIWSKNAAESDWVPKEIFAAINRGKKIVPIVLDSTPLPDSLKDVKYIEVGADSTVALEVLKQLIGERADAKSAFYIIGALVLIILGACLIKG